MRKFLSYLLIAIAMVACQTSFAQGGINIPAKYVLPQKPRLAPFVENGVSSASALANYLQYNGELSGCLLSPDVYGRLIGQAIARGTVNSMDFTYYLGVNFICDRILKAPFRNVSWRVGEYKVYAISRDDHSIISINRASHYIEPVLDLMGDGNVYINMRCGNIMIRSDYTGQNVPVEQSNGPCCGPTVINNLPEPSEMPDHWYDNISIGEYIIMGLLLLLIGLLIGYMLGRHNETHTTVYPPVYPSRTDTPPQAQRTGPVAHYDNCRITNHNYYDGAPGNVSQSPAPQSATAQPAAGESAEKKNEK